MIVQYVKMKSGLSKEEILRKAREREPEYKAMKGLIQKYYVMDDVGQFGGIYVWDSRESLDLFRKSQLAGSIPEAYQAIGKPDIEILDVLFTLRE